MNERLFGTDGMRGVAGQYPLDAATVFQLGRSVTRILQREIGRPARVIIGRDTRESGAWLEQSVAAGVVAESGSASSSGIATTPAVAFFAKRFGFDAGIVISASHNPYKDNGIKIFSPTGRKLEDKFEREIEADLLGKPQALPATEFQIEADNNYNEAYLTYLTAEVGAGLDLRGQRIVLDCANGAASFVAPKVFAALGAEVIAFNVTPSGKNINADCGALHTRILEQAVPEQQAQLGIAFDGDADRALLVDDSGVLRDGDYLLYVIGRFMQARDELAGNRIVATVMSNLGLELGLRELGIDLARASVGDKYVLEELLKSENRIGGEQSGHIIFPHISLAGDGLITALQTLRVIAEEKKSLRELASDMQKYPQILINIKVGRKPPFESVPEIKAAADKLERELSGRGRLLLRYSGTENLARVMIEGKDQAAITAQANQLAELIKGALS